MTPYASVALFRRNGSTVFRPPRKERPDDISQARKSAIRFWRKSLADGDTLAKVIVMRERNGVLEVSERAAGNWIAFSQDIAAALREPHLAACVGELGIDPARAPVVMPDTLEINGMIYRRDI